jgi:SanA protein
MGRKLFRLVVRVALGAAVGLLLVFGLPRLVTADYAKTKRYPLVEAPAARVAIVFGAGLQRSGSPSPVLRDRIETAVALYEAGKVEKLLMSGDNRFVEYNEPGAMSRYAAQLGVPEEDIVLDFAGRRTYDTCYRARHIFGMKQAILVTQDFHMPRALYTCNHLGVQSVGVPADGRFLRRYRVIWAVREVLATTVAFWEIWVARPLPVLGKPEPIFPETSAPPLFDRRLAARIQEGLWTVPRLLPSSKNTSRTRT